MPVVKVNFSNNNIELLNKIKERYNLESRTQALEMIIEQVLQDREELNPKPAE